MHDCTIVKLSKHTNDAHFDAVDNAQAMHKTTPLHRHLLYFGMFSVNYNSVCA